MDQLLLRIFSQEFKAKYGCDPETNPKTRLRLLDQIEKTRKLLTANKDTDLHVEALMEDEDLHRKVTRDELEMVSAGLLERVKKVMMMALSRSGISPEHLHSIELVGEATRIPCIKETIKSVFHAKKLQRTLNSQECIARGCALQAALLKTNKAGMRVEEFNKFSTWAAWKDGSGKDCNSEVFKPHSLFPATHVLRIDNHLGDL
jgi:heat shock protein 4